MQTYTVVIWSGCISYCCDRPLNSAATKSRNVGQFGPGVWPSVCCRNARRPPVSPVSTAGKRTTGPAASGQALRSQQHPHRRRCHRRQKHTVRVHPLVANRPRCRQGTARTHKRQPRRTQRQQFMLIHRQVGRVQRVCRILQQGAGLPVELARRLHVLQLLAKCSTPQVHAAGAAA